MPDLEKVIRAIENCIDDEKCRDCPWEKCESFEDHNPVNMPYSLMIETLSLLKAQEPRPLKPEDFDDNPLVDEKKALPVWVEYRKMNGIARPDDGWTTITRTWVNGYWDRRFWTGKPTKEQREAVKWNAWS